MSVAVVFIIFLICMAVSLSLGLSMIFPLLVGLVLFCALAVRKGFTIKELAAVSKDSLHDSFIVVGILILVGCLTGLWRACGTIAYFVTVGVSMMPPKLFILAAFLLNAAMSYAFGTSFGVTATAGVIIMSIARAGGVNPVLAGAAVMSGVYVGDRGSPAASSANLVAVLTHTDMRSNVRRMFRTSIIPFIICCVFYLLLSFFYPMERADAEVLGKLAQEFNLSWFCLIPAVLMIILPFCRVSIRLSMAVSMAASFVIGVSVQKLSVLSCLKFMLFGFAPRNAELSSMLSGGGIISMLEICVILLISGSYGGIFRATGLLQPLTGALEKLADKTGRFAAMLVLGAGVCAVFCNQTIGVIMQNQLSSTLYGDSEEEKNEKMIDIENSAILIAGLVPWCIACSVPLAMLGVGYKAIPFSMYLWLVPLYNLIYRVKHKN